MQKSIFGSFVLKNSKLLGAGMALGDVSMHLVT